jgi:hypothetical protein
LEGVLIQGSFYLSSQEKRKELQDESFDNLKKLTPLPKDFFFYLLIELRCITLKQILDQMPPLFYVLV